jgi:hypothetical protein
VSVPTAPYTSDANTQLLCNFTNAGIFDATSKNDLETVGNAQISTAQSKFGGSSMLFDGTGDLLKGPYQPIAELGSGDFTIEGWVYSTSSAAALAVVVSAGWVSPSYVPFMITNSSGTLRFYASSNNSSWDISDAQSIGAATLNTWTHFAVSRYGSSIRLFNNGILVTTITSSSALMSGANKLLAVGAGTDGNNAYTGYIDDLRITKGIARYTSNFTPPTTAFLTL